MAYRSEMAFLFPTAKKVRKPRVAKKAIKVGASVRLHIDGNVYIIAERDVRYKNAWFIINAAGERAPTSFNRDVMEVL